MPIVRARDFRYGGRLQTWEWLYHIEALLDLRDRALADPWAPYGLEWRRRVGALLEAAFSGSRYHAAWTASPGRTFDSPPPEDTPQEVVDHARDVLGAETRIAQEAFEYERDFGDARRELLVPGEPNLRGEGWTKLVVGSPGRMQPHTKHGEQPNVGSEARLATEVSASLLALDVPVLRDVAVGESKRLRADFAVDVPDFGRTLIEVKRTADEPGLEQVRVLGMLPGVAEAILVVPAGAPRPADTSVVVLTADELGPYLKGRSGLRGAVGAKVAVGPSDLTPWRTFATVAALFAVAIGSGVLALGLVGLLDTLWRPLAAVGALAVFLAAAAGILVQLAPVLGRLSWKPVGVLQFLRSQFVLTTVATTVGTVVATLFLAWVSGSWVP